MLHGLGLAGFNPYHCWMNEEKLTITAFARKYEVSKQYVYNILNELRVNGPKYIIKADVTVELVEEELSDNTCSRFLIIEQGNKT